MKRYWIKRAPFFILLGIVALFAVSGAVMLLWNAILPAVFHIGVITFWQAMGILVLAKILFSGFRGRGHHHMRPHWAKHMRRKWHRMSPEEREMFLNKMKDCRHHWDRATDPDPAV